MESDEHVVDAGNGFHDKNRAMKEAWDAHIAAAKVAAAEGDSELEQQEHEAADRIRHEFILFNLGQAGSIVRKWCIGSDVANAADYKQAAVVGMLEAFEKWDPDKGTWATFSHMAVTGTTQRTVRAYTNANISYGDWNQKPAVLAAETKLKASIGRTPTDDEISKATGISVGVVERVRRPAPTSLDAPVGDGENSRGDLIAADDDLPDFNIGGTVELTEDQEETLLEALRHMTALQCASVARQFGLDGAPAQTFAETGELLGMSREAIRRACGKAIEDLEFTLG